MKPILLTEIICLRAPPRGKEEVHSLSPHKSQRAARGRAEDHSPPPDDHTQKRWKPAYGTGTPHSSLASTESQILLELGLSIRAVQCCSTNSHLDTVKSMGLSRNTSSLEPINLSGKSQLVFGQWQGESTRLCNCSWTITWLKEGFIVSYRLSGSQPWRRLPSMKHWRTGCLTAGS